MTKKYLLILLLLLASCGGGGGGSGGSGSGSSAPVTGDGNTGGGDTGGGDTPPSWISAITIDEANVYRTAEYNNQWGLEAIHSAEAYALLENNNKTNLGDGVIIGITDTGMQINHSELAAATSGLTHSNNLVAGEEHATHVAGIAAAAKNSSGMQGVAPDASILAVKMIGATPPGSSGGFAYAVNNGAKVINASWCFGFLGCTQVDVGSGTYDSHKSFLSGDLNSLVSGDALLTAATGNDGYNNYIGTPALFAQDADYAGHIIAVGSVDDNLNISSFSNRCKAAKNYCLVAPGENINSSIPTNTYDYFDGTSMATPHVAGAAAVIRAAWTFLTAPQVTQILLTSATDLGAAGVDDIYGHGLLNLYAAVQAQGQNTLGYGASVANGGYDLRSSSLISSPIFGDAFAHNIAPQLNSAIFFDDYGRDYKAHLGNKISAHTPISPLSPTNLLLNNISYRTVPLQLSADNKTQMSFNLSSYKNPDAQNDLGLRFITLDRSVDPQIYNGNNGFSFTQKDAILPNSKFGFAFNHDEISASQAQEFGNFGFILKNNFASNPYQSFLQDSQFNFQNSRKFNQFFLDQNFSNQKFALKFSYQSSYDNQQILGKGGDKQNQILDFGLAFKTKNNGNFLISAGSLTEFNNNMLNSRSLGAFESQGNVKTSYLKFSASQELFKGLKFIVSFSEGISKINGNQTGIFREFNDVRSRSTSLALVHDNFMKGSVGITYLEPLRVYSGNVKFNIPIARDYAGNLIRYSGTASLVPQGRERDVEMFYSRDLNNFSNIRFNLVMQKDAGNIKGAITNYLGFVSYKKGF